MSETKHSAGPWEHTPLQDTVWANGGEVKIAKIADLPWINGKSDWMTEEANAKLIAAAPELLEALKELRAYCDLKLLGFRRDYAEDHCMVQTPIRMIALADQAISRATT